MPNPAAVAAVALCVFLVTLTFLAWQLRAGHDPALGGFAPAVPTKQISAPVKAHAVSAPVTKSSGGG